MKSNSRGQSKTGPRCKYEIMTKEYKNDKRSKANKTKGQAQKNSQDIQSLWRKSTNTPSATVNERSSTTSPAVAASTSGGAEVREVSAVQNRLQLNEFASAARIQVDPPGERADERMVDVRLDKPMSRLAS